MVDHQGEPVVMDFGLARRSESDDVQVTHSGVILGTPAYMSPEQVDGDQSAIGPQTDIYALGVIMYELITGELPFNGALMTLLAQISANNPTPPSALRDGLDPRLENICLKMMAGDLKQRYQSMSDVAVDLQSVLRQPNRNQKKEEASESGLRPSSVPTSDEDSHPALVSVAEPISFTNCSQTSPHEPKRNKKKFLFAGGLLGGVLILGIVIFVRVEMYEVQITVDDPSIVLSIDNKVIEMDSSDNVIKLSPGEHQLKLQKDELKPHVENFTVARGGKTSLRAVVVEGRLDGLVNGEQPTVISKKTDTTELLELSPTNPQPGEFALRFTEGDRVEIPTLKLTHRLPVTIEAVVHVIEEPPQANSDDKKAFRLGMFGGLVNLDRRNWGLHQTWMATVPSKSHGQVSLIHSDTSRTAQIAVVYDQKNLQLFVNGTPSWHKMTQQSRTETIDELPELSPFDMGTMLGIDFDDQWNRTFEGELSEIRISKIARYTEPYQPRSHLEADEQTIALYHFDEGTGDLLKDSSGNGHHGRIIGAKWVKTDGTTFSKQTVLNDGPALLFDKPGSYVDVPSIPVDFNQPFCVESWCNPRDVARTKNRIRVLSTFGPCQLSIDQNREIAQAVIVDVLNQEKPLVSREIAIHNQLEKEELHIALQWTGDDLLLFVNGVPHSKNFETWKHHENPITFIKRVTAASKSQKLRIGNFMDELTVTQSEDGHFSSSIHSFRISQGLRYRIAFTPEKFTPDEQTLALYKFNEGTGDLLKDSSGNGHHGRIIGAKWVRTKTHEDASSSQPPSSASQYMLSFDGVDDYVELPQFEKNESVTVEAICTPDRYAHSQVVASRGFYLSMSPEQESWCLTGRGGGRDQFVHITSAEKIKFGQQVTLAGVFDGKNLSLFVDGKLVDTRPSSRPAPYFRIGAVTGPPARLFSGTISAVRISRGARYNEDYSVTESWQSDENTLALYQFSEGSGDLLKDASGNRHHGTIIGAKWIRSDTAKKPIKQDSTPSASGGYALRFDGTNSEPFVAKLENVDPIEEYTAEAWVTSEGPSVTKHYVEVLGPKTGAVIRLSQNDVSGWMAYRFHAVVEESPGARVPFSRERTHIANVYSTGKIGLFVNGEFKGSSPVMKPPMQFDTLRLGPQFKDVNFQGIVDEVRLSRVARYTEDFQPDERFEPDDKTVVLYHFDEGTGDIAKDSSGNGHHGKIIGAKWVKLP